MFNSFEEIFRFFYFFERGQPHGDMSSNTFYLQNAKTYVGIIWNKNSVEMTVQNGDMGGCDFTF